MRLGVALPLEGAGKPVCACCVGWQPCEGGERRQASCMLVNAVADSCIATALVLYRASGQSSASVYLLSLLQVQCPGDRSAGRTELSDTCWSTDGHWLQFHPNTAMFGVKACSRAAGMPQHGVLHRSGAAGPSRFVTNNQQLQLPCRLDAPRQSLASRPTPRQCC